MVEQMRAIGPDGQPVDPAELQKKQEAQAAERAENRPTEQIPVVESTKGAEDDFNPAHVREMPVPGANHAREMPAIDVRAELDAKEVERQAAKQKQAAEEARQAAKDAEGPHISEHPVRVDIPVVKSGESDGEMDPFFTDSDPNMGTAA